MNSSSSNSNNGFSNFHETKPILGFNSPPLAASSAGAATSSGSNLSRPRLLKGRKQTSSHNHKSTDPVDNRLAGADRGLGFNQFRIPSESVLGNLSSGSNRGNNSSSYWGSQRGVSSGTSNVILDDLSIDDYKQSVVDNKSMEISKLKIEGTSNIAIPKDRQILDPMNKTQFTKFVNANLALELQNDMKKMNLKDPAESDNLRSYVFGQNRKSGNSCNEEEEAKANLISDRMQELKVSEAVKDIVKEDFGFDGRSSSENFDTFEAYSPMDISPCDRKLAGNYSRETSVTSEEASGITDQNNVSGESHVMSYNEVARDEGFESHINEVSETESFKSATENLEYSSDTFVTDSDENSTATSTQAYNFGSKSGNTYKDSFTFAASSSSHHQLPSDIRQHKKKHPLKVIRDSYSSTAEAKNLYVSPSSAEFFPISGNFSILSPGKGQKVDLSTSSSKRKDNLKQVNEQEFRHETVTTSSSSKIAEEACEKWRLRGNQAYSNGDLSKAEGCYTQGLNSVSQSEESRSCLRALMMCYSNRAATRVSLGRMREAIEDCLMAATIDPSLLKVQVRVAFCYLAIGETENAKQQYMKCLQSVTDDSMDKKVIAEATEGLEKAQKVSDWIKQCSDLFKRRASEDLECALRVIDEALKISMYSEELLQMKGDALFMLRRYAEVIHVCEQTRSFVEGDTPASSSSRLWRSRLIVKSYFYLGKLDEALEFIKKQENSGNITESSRAGNTSGKSAIPLGDTIRDLLSRKAAGNEAYKSGKHAEAVEHYTVALSCNAESRPFAAICFCNRAAAYRALGQITDAIADCSLAVALDPNYLKAISRRASLYERIRDYGQTAIDVERLVSLLTTAVEEKGAQSGALDKLSRMNELKQTQLWLSNVEQESRKGNPLNMYLILGVESTASTADIKKAYRKAALRHHPDKAAQSLSRNDDGDDRLWKEIAENVHKDADRLFKMIGQAYAVLSNPSKRSRYDQHEEIQTEANGFTRSNSSRMAEDVQNSAFERSGSRRQWQDVNTQPKGSAYMYSWHS